MGDAPIIGIVGAGPAGMMAALLASRGGSRALLFDTNPVVGRKLLVTGNGRCNLSNSNVAAQRFACADPAFLEQAFRQFGREHLLATLREMGILTYATHDGWYYPVSNSAATVQESFASALKRAGVELCLQTKISDIRLQNPGFVLEAGGRSHTYRVDQAVVAAGGRAYPALGSRGECFPILQKLGHTIVPVRPALAPIRADINAVHKLQGVRLDARLAIYRGDEKLAETVGNLMFTEFGFSGPAAMDLSHLVRSGPGEPPQHLLVDLIPTHLGELQRLIQQKRSEPVPLRIILGAVLPVKVPPVFIGLAGLPVEVALNQVSSQQLDTVIGLLTGFSVEVRGTRGFQFSQVSAGGVPVTEVDPRTMASRRVKGLYLAGEVLDVVGPCGGFNLQFAFSSGAIAGVAAARTGRPGGPAI